MSASSLAETQTRWNLATRIGFRFAFCYLVLYNFPFPIDWIPFLSPVSQIYHRLWLAIVNAAGRTFFGTKELVVLPNGSGDTTYGYLSVFCMLVIAVAVTIVWSIADRKRPNYTRLHEWLRIYVRFSLAFIMLAYAATKVIPSQFPPPPLDRLLQPFGDASPMGLMWTFIGFSTVYQIFSGLMELAGGLLLTTRRTTLLGALLTAGVMANITIMNFCFDVPVKLFAVHLLAMAVFLTLPDLRRLLDFFVLHAPTDVFRTKWMRVASLVLRTGFVAFVVYTVFMDVPPLFTRSPLYGIYQVDTFTVNGVVRPAEDPARWQRVIFDNPASFAVQMMNDSRTRWRLSLDEKQRTFKLTSRDDPNRKSTLSYTRPDPGSMIIEGALEGQPIHATLHKVPIPAFRLTSRGFHWINEYPFNR
jgi:hypothetical protein